MEMELGHGGEHGAGGSENKKIALLIAVLALVLALSETLGKSAQTTSISYNIEAANLWAFFQAKTIRMTTVRTAAEALESQLALVTNTTAREDMAKRVAEWKKTAARYDSDPDTREGRKELADHAKASEAKRDRALAAYHKYELSSAALQIAIVLASAAIITATRVLVWIAGALGVAGIVFIVIAVIAPAAHVF